MSSRNNSGLTAAPIWHTVSDTPQRVRRRLGAVMKWAIAEGHRTDNPAGDALSGVLLHNRSKRVHHPAVPHKHVSAALATVRDPDPVNR